MKKLTLILAIILTTIIFIFLFKIIMIYMGASIDIGVKTLNTEVKISIKDIAEENAILLYLIIILIISIVILEIKSKKFHKTKAINQGLEI